MYVRYRTASDLEELGFIDKAEKGLIKDLIISGDTKLQALLDKYEQGDGQELLALIKDGYLAMRKPSIELIEGLDFDFINALRDDDDQQDGGFFADMDADFAPPSSSAPTAATTKKDVPMVKKERRASTDEVADLLQGHSRSRLGTLDAFSLHDLIFDDDHHHLGGGAVKREHDDLGLLALPGDEVPSDVFTDLYQQFSGSASHQPSGFGASGGSGVDLSAYAHHAAALQQQDRKAGPKNTQKAGAATSAAAGANKATQKKTAATPPSSSSAAAASQATAPSATFAGTFGAPHAGTGGGSHSGGNNSNNHSSSQHGGSSSSSPYMFAPNSGAGGGMLYSTGAFGGAGGTGGSYGGYHLHSGQMLAPGAQPQMPHAAPGSGLSVTATAQNAAAMRPPGFIGAYSPEQRRQRIEKFLEKRARRVWSRKVKYDVRKNFADSRLRIKGRFVKKEDEDMMRELMNI